MAPRNGAFASGVSTPSRAQGYFACISIAALYSAAKSTPVSMVGSICRNAVYVMASRCRPENLPGSAFRDSHLRVGDSAQRRMELDVCTVSVGWWYGKPSAFPGSM